MTIKLRSKYCLTCGVSFIEKRSESNKQWASRLYCGIKCNNSSKERFTCIFERMDRRVLKTDGCWGWSGSVDGHGYGTLSNRMGSKYSPEKLHRVSYEKYFGKIPEGFYICHKCDNPICSNPDHLFIGTQKDNMKDCSRKGRLRKKSLLNLNRKKSLSENDVKEIRLLKFAAKNGRGGVTVKEVAKKYGVCTDLITDVKYNRYEV